MEIKEIITITGSIIGVLIGLITISEKISNKKFSEILSPSTASLKSWAFFSSLGYMGVGFGAIIFFYVFMPFSYFKLYEPFFGLGNHISSTTGFFLCLIPPLFCLLNFFVFDSIGFDNDVKKFVVLSFIGSIVIAYLVFNYTFYVAIILPFVLLLTAPN